MTAIVCSYNKGKYAELIREKFIPMFHNPNRVNISLEVREIARRQLFNRTLSRSPSRLEYVEKNPLKREEQVKIEEMSSCEYSNLNVWEYVRVRNLK